MHRPGGTVSAPAAPLGVAAMIRRLRLLLRQRSNPDKMSAQVSDTDAALAQLRVFTDRELADIGLSRGCLTPEGLENCSSRRLRR